MTLLMPGAAMAQPSPAETRAQVRFKAGQDLFNKGDFEGARLEFLQAQVIYPRPSLLRSLAACELHMGRSLEALKHLQEFMADPNLPADQRAQAEPNFAKAYAATGHVTITAPAGAHLKVDGTDAGVSPLKDPVDVVVGTHAVDGTLGDGVAHASVQADAGKVTPITLTIAGSALPVVAAGPGLAPPEKVTVLPLYPPLQEKYWNTRRTVGVVVAGVGVVSLVLGGVFGAERGSQTSDATADQTKLGTNGGACSGSAASSPTCSSLANALHSNGSDASLEAGFLIGGGVLVAAGLVTTLWPSGSREPGTGIRPAVGPHLAGVEWGGSF